MSRRLLVPFFALLSVLLVLPTVTLAEGHTVSQQLAQVRRATAKYHNVSKALADGYLMTNECVASPAGTMGYHFIKPSLMADSTLDIEEPEVLVYRKLKNGKYRLVAVEYLVFDTGQPHPSLFGRPLNGPMPGHAPGMPVHYDLHAWVWKHNPTGIFEDWNPTFGCP